MIAFVVLTVILIGTAYRLRRDTSAQRRNGWRQALAINAILLLIYAARAVSRWHGGHRLRHPIAASEDLTTP